MPLVSIITPSYNQGQFIEDTLLSVKNQDYPNIEHIIVDGGSTDNTLEILKKYEGTYNMQWISEPDEGQADAVNKGFKMARGEIIGWLNSDDGYLTRDFVSQAVNTFIDEPDVYVVYGNRVVIDKNNNFKKLKYSHDFDYQKFLFGRQNVFQESVIFRRQVIQNYRLNKKLQFAMDTDFWLKIGKHYKFKYIKNLLGFFREHTKNKTLSRNYSHKWSEEWYYLHKQYGYVLKNSEKYNSLSTQIYKKLSCLLSGSYKNYLRLPYDLAYLSIKFPSYFTISLNMGKRQLIKSFFSSIIPHRQCG